MNTREYGRLGEESAARFLESEGYDIVGRNIYVSHDEIDVVAENDSFVVFAEVKTRRQFPDKNTDFGTPASAVNVLKQSNLIRSAEQYLLEHPTNKSPRIDVIEVYTDPSVDTYKVLEIRHIENAVTKRGKFSRKPR